MAYTKNQEVIITITDIGENGEGIGKCDGYTLFVKGATIGDTVRAGITKANKSYGYGRVVEIIEQSPFRTEPLCPVSGPCGGCQLQHLSYEKQLEFKENKVKALINRVGKIKEFEMLPIKGMKEPYHYRNKAQYPVRAGRDGGIKIGFYAGRSHNIIEADMCGIQHPVNKEIIGIVREWMTDFDIIPYNEENCSGTLRHILTRVGFSTGEIMVCLVINRHMPHTDELVERLKAVKGMKSICLNINKENTNVILGNRIKLLYGEGYITDKIGGITYRISPLSFYQVNPVQTKVLYDTVLEFADFDGHEVLWDMYCGIGTIGLYAAGKVKKVFGVEIIPEAVEDAKNNADINGITNAEFFAGKAEEVLPEMYKSKEAYADAVIVDPPRKGCDVQLLETMVSMAPKKIIYVSCDPGTLARDLKFLDEKSYKLQKVQCVDVFPQTVHVETVVLLSRKDT